MVKKISVAHDYGRAISRFKGYRFSFLVLLIFLLAGCGATNEEISLSQENIQQEEIAIAQSAEPEQNVVLFKPIGDDYEQFKDDEKFHEGLLRRLLDDDILVYDSNAQLKNEFALFSQAQLAETDYMVIDIDGDGALEVGIKHSDLEILLYKYDPWDDSLTEFISLDANTEILNSRRILQINESEGMRAYSYIILDSRGKPMVTIDFQEFFEHTDDVSDVISYDYYINSVQFTKEQWDALIQPLWEAREYAPKPLTYEELMKQP